jgi:acyl-homoserine-lactone acylase
MMRSLRLLLLPALLLPGRLTARTGEMSDWRAQAARVTIVRDTWGIPHIDGRDDADAVFGMMYAQAEDDFPRIEANYLAALGRSAEANGENAIWADLRQRFFVDEVTLKAEYARSPAWLKKLMQGWADGLNFYLATHPQVKPEVLTRFEPWMALSFTEGSIGGDIEKISLSSLESFYGRAKAPSFDETGAIPREPRGSNGIAIAPRLTKDGRALLLINPHTSFYFRSEAKVTSREGLNAYGASTWGQFFIYQGFNAHAGWMHTTSGADNVDQFAETIEHRSKRLFYRYGREWRPLTVRPITILYRAADGSLAKRTFTTYRTHHGPIVAAQGAQWIAHAQMWKPVAALEQSFLRTKAIDLASYLRVAERKANSSNNTLFADRNGNIAFLMPQFMPRRDDRFDYSRPVDGANPATDWRALHSLSSLPSVANPWTGWVYNTNDWPYDSAGAATPRAAAYPQYMDRVGKNFRGAHALALLQGSKGWTPERLRAAAYDPDLPAFKAMIPGLVEAWRALPAGDARRTALAEPVALLERWDARWSAKSQATTLAVFWGEAMWAELGEAAQAAQMNVPIYLASRSTPEQKLAGLSTAVTRLQRDFGDWRVPWGEVNRWQRLEGTIGPLFNDSKPSIPVPFTSAHWGSLAAYGSRAWPGTKRYYGTLGNSFVAVVEFGPRVKAMAVHTGGQSGDPASPHFRDQSARYASGDLRRVYFYPDELAGNVKRRYRPGE